MTPLIMLKLIVTVFLFLHLAQALIPKPRSITYDAPGTEVRLPSLFTFNIVNEEAVRNCDLFYHRVVHFKKILAQHKLIKVNKGNSVKLVDLKSFQISLKTTCVDSNTNNRLWPSESMDESYTLQVLQTGDISLLANEIWGILHGLETVLQLINVDEYGQQHVPIVSISDAPRFKHRGLMIDTSRHFLPVRVIEQQLRAMSKNKLNVLHWHIVDDDSFPYQSRTFPLMSELGAYDSARAVYSQVDIDHVQNYARRLGIRVIPEFDSPGHTKSWGLAIPKLLTPCYSQSRPDGTFGPVDPSVNSTFDFLKSLTNEISQVFHDNYLHLGGDEVSFDCWKSNPNINQFMQTMGFGGNYAKLEEYYMTQLIQIVKGNSKGSKLMIWQEVIDNGAQVPAETIIHIWKGGWEKEMAQVTNMGYNTILSTCWYLDIISYGEDWKTYYQCEPLNFSGTSKQKELVVGGEACIWGEYVDKSNAVSRVWPRASAVAERLWSPQNTTDMNDFETRITQMRCYLINLGIAAEPATHPTFC